MSRSYDIAIAGAGPAGLAAALYLKRAGHKVTIFERFDAPKPVGSGLILLCASRFWRLVQAGKQAGA